MTERRRSVAINGFGRIGRLVARILLQREGETGLVLTHVNEIKGDVELASHMLEFDTTHGRLGMTCVPENGSIRVGDHLIGFTNWKNPDECKWPEDVEVIFDCTGSFLNKESMEKHFLKGSKLQKVIVSAPIEKDVPNIVLGCNDHVLKEQSTARVMTAASCTTNCAAPIVGVIDKAFGIELAALTTMHNVTPTQAFMDVMDAGKKKDVRRARSGALNLAPTTTGSAKAVAALFPHLQGKFDGLAVRVPMQRGASILDLVVTLKTEVTKAMVNDALKEASGRMPGILGFETRPLVSTDFVTDSRSGIVDASSTQVIAKKLVKIIAWYDNEWGYSNRMIEIAVQALAANASL